MNPAFDPFFSECGEFPTPWLLLLQCDPQRAAHTTRWHISPHSLSVGCAWSLLPKRTVWTGGKRVTEQWANLMSAASTRCSRSTSSVTATQFVPLRWCGQNCHFASVIFLPQKTHNPSLIMRKCPNWGTFHKNLPSTLQNCQDHQKQGGKSSCHSCKEPEMIGNQRWCGVLRRSQNRKGISDKNYGNMNEVLTLANTASILVH